LLPPPASELRLPADWPRAGPIDLQVHDLPHSSASLEWWYVNAHLETLEGRELGIFAAFFRQARGRGERGELRYTHSVAWALSDPQDQRYVCKVAVDADAAALGLEKLDAGAGLEDERIRRALREVFARGTVPGPTRSFAGAARVGTQSLALDFGGDRLRKTAAGYELELSDERQRLACNLLLSPRKPAIRHGQDGVVHGAGDERMFYYFVPRCEVSGSVQQNGAIRPLVAGSGWYDHEFGFVPEIEGGSAPARERRGETTWRWLSLQLSDGRDVSVYFITRRQTDEILDRWTIVVDADGTRHEYGDAQLEQCRTWRSTRSFIEYPIAFRLQIPSLDVRLQIEAEFADQEVLTVIADPGFWEGRVRVTGTVGGNSVRGRGWLECKGFRFNDLDQFFAAVGKEVRARVAACLSSEPTPSSIAQLGASGGSASEQELSSLPEFTPGALVDGIVRPIREIADRGGKGWRSYAALACIDVVGGDSRRFLHWLAMPELLHVGSLIVDDVEDGSSVRRGGPSCHRLYGEACAINAGTAAYFLAEPPVHSDPLPVVSKLEIYQLYFAALRAGHAGQALDLRDPAPFVESALARGRPAELESHVLLVHRLKTAVPAGMMARVGALLGRADSARVEALGKFFEAVGLAFQIIDDVLNLRGFEHDLKERGEDLRNGKLTLPVARALALVPEARRRPLWAAIRAQPRDAAQLSAIVEQLETVGALQACENLARRGVEEAWSGLDPLLEESQYKVMFRAFSWYVLERHY
jgi:geranylgeranyl pyrophosphate synthase/predicted secreted hydrolase